MEVKPAKNVTSSSRSATECMVHDWQFPNANAGGGEDRICKRGSDGRQPRFACPAEPCIPVMNVHFDFWTIRKMYHLIIGNVLVYHSTIGDRDFAIERCAKAKTIPPSICARKPSGLTALPQSAADVRR
jgi:hypothetical protein